MSGRSDPASAELPISFHTRARVESFAGLQVDCDDFIPPVCVFKGFCSFDSRIFVCGLICRRKSACSV